VVFSLILSLIVLSAAGLAFYTGSREDRITTVDLLVAKREIGPRSTVVAEDLAAMRFVEGYEPPNAIPAKEVSRIVGRETITRIQKGDVIAPSLFGATDGNLDAGIAGIIPDGKRVTYITPDDTHVIPPDIRRGNRVDVVAIAKDAVDPDTQRILNGVEVFDVVRSAEEGSETISLLGILLTENENARLSSRLTSKWTLQVLQIPQNEKPVPVTNEDDRDASPSAR
jgi:Flp pilus assembly protein CpaB